jgi:hypothetical protein
MTINELLTAYDKSLTTELEGQVFTLTGTLMSNDRKPWGRQLYWHVVAEGARLKVCIDRDDSRFRASARIRVKNSRMSACAKN